METIGQRIARLRKLAELSRPELGRQMAKAIDRPKAFTGELIRKYEADENEPGNDARQALAAVFHKTPAYIEFGDDRTVIANDVPKAFTKPDDKELAEVVRLWEYLGKDQQAKFLEVMRDERKKYFEVFERQQERLPVSPRGTTSSKALKSAKRAQRRVAR